MFRAAAVLAVVLFAVGCGRNPAEICNDLTESLCEKAIACGRTTSTLEECISSSQDAQCKGLDERVVCDSGQAFIPELAEKCLKTVQPLSCEEYLANPTPGACESYCR